MSKKYPEFEHTLHSMPLNTLVKIVYKYEWRNKAERFIGSLNRVDDRFCHYEFGHPYLCGLFALIFPRNPKCPSTIGAAQMAPIYFSLE